MKLEIFALILLVLLLVFVGVNSALVSSMTDETVRALDALSPDEPDVFACRSVFDDFRARERYINLTVSHEDVMAIEDAFSELCGAAEARDRDTFNESKTRVRDALSHLARLSSLNLDSIL